MPLTISRPGRLLNLSSELGFIWGKPQSGELDDYLLLLQL